tara:strand:- start:910 stop:2022 length:1113 start_codon:yes stop_codon:yes gene_type:complete
MKCGKEEKLNGKNGNILMRVLITGNLGYVGSEVVKYFRKKYPGIFLAGYDTAFFKNLITSKELSIDRSIDIQYYGDVRQFNFEILSDYDFIIHLAAISNDPMGFKFKKVTKDINYSFSIELAKAAVSKGIKKFVFASSCSVYGSAGNSSRTEKSKLNPLTDYAISKVNTEKALLKIDKGDTIFTCLRLATACGMSDRLRLDLVLNDFVASAFLNNHIKILSDGSPLRPLINVQDMCRAFDWGVGREIDKGGQILICNAGSNDWNFSVKELALSVQSHFNSCEVDINTKAEPDKRSYRVNFDLFKNLAGKEFIPIKNLDDTITDLKAGLNEIGFNQKDFRNSNFMRLNVLQGLISSNRIDKQLYWNNNEIF